MQREESIVKMRTNVFVWLCMTFAAFAVSACTPDTGAAGKVFDLATNGGVEGVAVVATCAVNFEEDKPYARVETTTAADGTYTLTGLLPDREYGLSFAKVGYIVASRVTGHTAAGKTKRIGDVPLCPIPTTHGVYRLTDEDVQFLARFMRDPSVRPAHPLTYEPLPQATYTKTPIPGKEGEFTREFTVSRETVIPQIMHRLELTPSEPLMVLCNATERDPTIRPISEDASSTEERRFTAGDGRLLDPILELPLIDARCFVINFGPSFRGSGYLSLPSGFYTILVKSGGGVLASLFEVLDSFSGDNTSRCRAALVIMRHEIAAFRQANGRWPTYEEFAHVKYDGYPLSGYHNPFSTTLSKDADALGLKKGDSYVVLDDYERLTGWLYSSSTGEVWAATNSGNGEAGW